MNTSKCGARLILLAAMLVLFVVCAMLPAGATTYYVSPTGNDENDGSAPDDAHAWLTITNGEVKGGTGVLVAGDIVEVQAGPYEVTSVGVITHSGVTYRANGMVMVYYSGPVSQWDAILQIDGASNVVIDGFDFGDCTNTIQLLNSASYITIANCYFHTDTPTPGGPYHYIDMTGTPGGSDPGAQANINVGCVIRNNIMRNNETVKWERMVWAQYDDDLLICNNVIDGANEYALQMEFNTNVRIKNNILVNNRYAVAGWPDPAQVMADHNLYLNNGSNDNGYCTHGEGEIYGTDPMLVDGVPPALPPVPFGSPFDPPFDFHLTPCSPCIDAGVVAYPGQTYDSTAPDIGAFESPFVPGNGARLTVTVTLPGGSPLPGANVEVVGEGISKTTNLAGQAQFCLTPGVHNVTATFRDGTASGSPDLVIGENNLTLSLDYTKFTFHVKEAAAGGDDYADGLTLATAWASIDNGDKKHLLYAGDTVLVEPGTYNVGTAAVYLSNCTGVAGNNIIYKANGAGVNVQSVEETGGYGMAFYLGNNARYITIDGFDISTFDGAGFYVQGADYITIKNCYVHDAALRPDGWAGGIYLSNYSPSPCDGIAVETCVFKNIGNSAAPDQTWTNTACIVSAMTTTGLTILNTDFIGNGTSDSDPGLTDLGIWMAGWWNQHDFRIQNNIFVGMWNAPHPGGSGGGAMNIASADGSYGTYALSNNLYWQNESIVGPAQTSAVYADPLFEGGSTHFGLDLLNMSAAIDRGIVAYTGQPFSGGAPDLGAFESSYTRPTFPNPPFNSLSDIKGAANGTTVTTDAHAVTGVFDNTFYLEATDRSNGIRVDINPIGAWFDSIWPGQMLQVTGTVQTDASSEQYILADIGQYMGSGSVTPLMMNNRSLIETGLSSIGLLVTTTGRVTESAADSFTIEDGSGIGVKVLSTLAPAVNAYMTVTGDSSCWMDGSTVKPMIRMISSTTVIPAP